MSTTPEPYAPYDPSHRLATPPDPQAAARAARLREIGIGDAPVPEFDDFAKRLAHITGAPYAMVNFIDEHRQYFAGLYSQEPDQAGVELPQQDQSVGREMPKDHGWCPHVVTRRKAMPLGDVCAYPRFAGNPVIDKLGVRAYLGTPLIDTRTGMTLGTICVVDTETREWGQEGVETIKAMAEQLVRRIHDIEDGL
ncbi:GAF domain-containing protein [Streptomyces jeddahensis]|uniref:GAF domain protein n=1 Tax=Streptomyces jeddahensis TaxID=1716141 RepID=A0A177HR56_9ACTN|nr:GAF domain-containing protein [Streptomyces jeddahensis]OAH13375.1 GAF domain protein [Streptomyces jeddahensis]